jgi:hypothetical protein
VEFAKQGGLRTKDPRSAEKLPHAKSEAYRSPKLNLTRVRGYLSAHDAKNEHTHLDGREMGTHGITSPKNAARTRTNFEPKRGRFFARPIFRFGGFLSMIRSSR